MQKIENHKLDWKAEAKTVTRNTAYTPPSKSEKKVCVVATFDNEGFMKSFELINWKFDKLANEPQANKTHSSNALFSLFICHFAPMTSCLSESKFINI